MIDRRNNTYKVTEKLMGNIFTLSIVFPNQSEALKLLDIAINEIRRIEKVFSTYSDSSETYFINKNAGINPVIVSKECFDLILRANRISEITQGAFDLSYGSVHKDYWNFNRKMTELPSESESKAAIKLINYKNIVLNEPNNSVFLKHKGMRIGFGGIAKGYAAEKAKILLKSLGVESGVVNASGDLCTWGSQENGQPWTIGISHPDFKNQIFSSVNISNKAIATSGNYEKFIMIKNKKYSHTIDPKTGIPIQGIKSVSIISPNAELSDALATPISIMGIKVGIDLIDQLPQVECVIIDDSNTVFTSKNINKI